MSFWNIIHFLYVGQPMRFVIGIWLWDKKAYLLDFVRNVRNWFISVFLNLDYFKMDEEFWEEFWELMSHHLKVSKVEKNWLIYAWFGMVSSYDILCNCSCFTQDILQLFAKNNWHKLGTVQLVFLMAIDQVNSSAFMKIGWRGVMEWC